MGKGRERGEGGGLSRRRTFLNPKCLMVPRTSIIGETPQGTIVCYFRYYLIDFLIHLFFFLWQCSAVISRRPRFELFSLDLINRSIMKWKRMFICDVSYTCSFILQNKPHQFINYQILFIVVEWTNITICSMIKNRSVSSNLIIKNKFFFEF